MEDIINEYKPEERDIVKYYIYLHEKISQLLVEGKNRFMVNYDIAYWPKIIKDFSVDFSIPLEIVNNRSFYYTEQLITRNICIAYMGDTKVPLKDFQQHGLSLFIENCMGSLYRGLQVGLRNLLWSYNECTKFMQFNRKANYILSWGAYQEGTASAMINDDIISFPQLPIQQFSLEKKK